MSATGVSSPAANATAQVQPKLGPVVKLGVTRSISLAEPTEADWLLSERMLLELEEEFPKETVEAVGHRERAVGELERVVAEWMVDAGLKAGKSPEEAKRCTVKLLTHGSYKLGVALPGSAVDVLCVGPPHIKRESFFSAFVDRLKEHPQVADCISVPDAFMPSVKLKMDGVSIDLLFVQLLKPLEGKQSLEEALKEDEVLKGMDEEGVRCISCYRVADQILQLVPNRESFRRTLRFIKCWAHRRGIHCNLLGFLGGVTWALLVARVCQLYPHYAPCQLVNRFFRVYDQWNWTRPVLLCEIQEPQNMTGFSGLKIWNPKANPSDKEHVMPVITPTFPAANSTANVTETTKRIVLDEFRRGYEMMESAEAHKLDWKKVHDPFPYFTHFRHFLWFEIVAKTEEVHHRFFAWIESKLQKLTKQLETISGMVIHPSPERYEMRGGDPDWPFGSGMFVAMAFTKDRGAFVGQTVSLKPALTQFVDVISQWSEKHQYSGLYLLRVKRIRGSQLPEYAVAVETLKKRPKSKRVFAAVE